MAVLSSMLLPLRLFLCFGLLCSSASSADDIDNCMLFNEVTTTGQGIMANPDVYESNTNYTVWVPVNASISSVVLRAVDANNNSLGLWEKVDQLCNNSALYHLSNLSDQLFIANWVSPHSTNITTIVLQHNHFPELYNQDKPTPNLNKRTHLHNKNNSTPNCNKRTHLHNHNNPTPNPNNRTHLHNHNNPTSNPNDRTLLHSQDNPTPDPKDNQLGQQNLPLPHHKYHSDPASLSHQQTPLLEGS
ncbi:placenta-expressed transcript 1 protein [Phoca vitulina]|uniref:placenta-expressed transcript 1 protein n=1 Tax=Phoca vitulina TaxID=9720 RepID=UPI0013964A50|nr:placenta-expressed transcript 1 protein [Phoca vitulina]